jgi:hypothetical protein
MTDFTKLSNLVDDTFKVEKVWGYKWKKWDNEASKMLVSETYQEGFSKKYELDTDKGKLDLGSGQLGSLLEAVFKNGVADLNDKTFEVKSNGKTGMDIRYYFNPIWNLKEEAVQQDAKEETDELFDSIPF